MNLLIPIRELMPFRVILEMYMKNLGQKSKKTRKTEKYLFAYSIQVKWDKKESKFLIFGHDSG